jgi:LPS export ABC transporter protein LptC
MTKKEDSSQVTLIIFLSCFFLLVSFVMIHEPKLNLSKAKKGIQPDFTFETVTISHIYDGELTWELESQYAEIDKASGKILMDNAVGDIFSNGTKIVNFDAPKARIKLDDSNMELKDSVSQFFMDDEVVLLRAKLLHWFSEKKTFIGEKSVSLTSGVLNLKGRYLTVDLDTKKMVMTNHAKATISMEKK